MVRITHVEADGMDVIADGHRVECRLPGSDATHTARSRQTGALPAVLDWMAGLVFFCLDAAGQLIRTVLAEVLNLFVAVLTALLRGCIRAIGALFAVVLLPLLHEVICIGGAAILCPAGALGRRLALVLSRAGTALQQRSLVLVATARVLTDANARATQAATQVNARAGRQAAPVTTASQPPAGPAPRELPPAQVVRVTHVLALQEPALIRSARTHTRAVVQPPSLGRGKG